MALESTLWRTLGKLITQPGRLTNAYIDGQRTQYLGPVRLFFSLSFIFLLVFSLLLENSVAVVNFYSEKLLEGDQSALLDLVKFAFSLLIMLSLSYALIIVLMKWGHGIAFGNALLTSVHYHSFTLAIVILFSLLIPLLSPASLNNVSISIVFVLAVYMAVMLWNVASTQCNKHWVIRGIAVLFIIAFYFGGYVSFLHGVIMGFFIA